MLSQGRVAFSALPDESLVKRGHPVYCSKIFGNDADVTLLLITIHCFLSGCTFHALHCASSSCHAVRCIE